MRGYIFHHSSPPTSHGQSAAAALSAAGTDWTATPYVHLWYPGDDDTWEAAAQSDPEGSGDRTAQVRSGDPWLSVDLTTYQGPAEALAVAVHVATRRSWWGEVTRARCRLEAGVWTVAGISGSTLVAAATTTGPGQSVTGITDPVALADLVAGLGL